MKAELVTSADRITKMSMKLYNSSIYRPLPNLNWFPLEAVCLAKGVLYDKPRTETFGKASSALRALLR
ncbi:MAG: hypothetical protein KAS54_03910, partial [Dehalococcoidia bacterium]|nr:hypothetical protein [Dehalococcoidia bacterium]